MKKLLIITTALILSASALAYARTDFKCMQECINDGHIYQFCQSQCSY